MELENIIREIKLPKDYLLESVSLDPRTGELILVARPGLSELSSMDEKPLSVDLGDLPSDPL